jgi:predicted esterase
MYFVNKFQMHLIGLLAGCCLTMCQIASSDEENPNATIVSESPETLDVPVTFLEHPPVIDGILDDDLSDLPVREYTRMIRYEYDDAIPAANYRLAYGTDFFYLYIEAEADSLAFRDRAYQMGDGFHMVLAVPQPDNAPTEEFYVLACSAVDQPRMEWSRRIFWYYNVHDIFVQTSDDTKLEFHDGDGVISFELFLPWHDVHPYHPWISEGIGFNLRLVRAFGETGTLKYDVVHDHCINCELKPRHYARLQFEEPISTGQAQTFVQADRGHIFEGDTLTLTAVTASDSAGEESVTVLVLAGEGDAVAYENTTYETSSGITRHTIEVDTERLIAGGYRIKWQIGTSDSFTEDGLTVLPNFDLNSIRSNFRKMPSNISLSSLSSMEFKLQEVAAQIDSAKHYETCLSERFRLARVINDIAEAAARRDPYMEETGFIRKAYLSDLDGTLQPYIIWVPEDFDPNSRYPMLVYLHGSASTEYDLLGSGARRMIPEGFIALAPRGRGTSNCYTFDNAQEDIAEAIDAVIADYPIDPLRIILSGFSMGGYGVYRTHYETPGKFRALAILSGNPSIAKDWFPGNDYPDFIDPEMLSIFRDVPIFIFHGEQDRNAPFELTRTIVYLLEESGARVAFYSEADKGHEEASEETYQAYYEWVRKVLNEE